MTATKRLSETSMPYIKIGPKLRPAVEIKLAELQKLLKESTKSVHECKTLPCMPAVIPGVT